MHCVNTQPKAQPAGPVETGVLARAVGLLKRKVVSRLGIEPRTRGSAGFAAFERASDLLVNLG